VFVHQTYANHEFSFIDAMTVAMTEYHKMNKMLSFDDDFDGVVLRLIPDTLTFQ
jgi:hypothetical protein